MQEVLLDYGDTHMEVQLPDSATVVRYGHTYWCSEVIIAGAKAPKYARGMGFTPVRSFEEAMERAKRIVGENPRILCTPECFSGGTAVHLHLQDGG